MSTRFKNLAVTAASDIHAHRGPFDGFFLRARLNVSLPGIDRETARAIVDEAHGICPYSKALSASIDIALNVI